MQGSALYLAANGCEVTAIEPEAAVIERCLQSVAWADEIILFDTDSSDGTPDLARALGAKVHCAPDWPGFGAQKNRALALATGEFVWISVVVLRIETNDFEEFLHTALHTTLGFNTLDLEGCADDATDRLTRIQR